MTAVSHHPSSSLEDTQDLVLGLVFLLLALGAGRRLWMSGWRSGLDTVTTFYTLIFSAAVLRAVWLLLPSSLLQPSYAPESVQAFRGHWLGTFLSAVLLSAGSLAVFSVFIHIVVNWSNLLRTVFKDSLAGSGPLRSFLLILALLVALEGGIVVLFLLGVYSSDGMILLNSVLLTVVSLVCCVEISVFSHRFRNVLQSFGAINQVSTESQMRLIVWITTTGNIFFVVRASCEMVVGGILFSYWRQHQSLKVVFDTRLWDAYIALVHSAEAAVLFLMLWMPELRQQPDPDQQQRQEYAPIRQGSGGGAESGYSYYGSSYGDDEEAIRVAAR